MKDINCINKISDIEKNYSLFLVDLWGVIHNGIKIFPEIPEVLRNLQKKKKRNYFYNQCTRRALVIENQLTEFGIDRKLYSRVISSGEITWRYLFEKFRDKNVNILHIGPPRDNHLIDGLNYKKVNKPEEAQIIVNTGPWGDNDKLENYKNILDQSLKK